MHQTQLLIFKSNKSGSDPRPFSIPRLKTSSGPRGTSGPVDAAHQFFFFFLGFLFQIHFFLTVFHLSFNLTVVKEKISLRQYDRSGCSAEFGGG